MSFWLEPAKKTVALGTGIRLAYAEAGTPGAPVVLLLHGGAATGRSFFPTMQALEEADLDLGLHVFALDLRGHGDSSMPAGPRDAAEPEACFGPDQLAADLCAFMDLQGIASAHLVGHSYGGLVAQELALLRPDRVRSIVLMSSCARAAGNAHLDLCLLQQVEGQWKQALQRWQGSRWPEDAHRLSRGAADFAHRPAALRWPQDAYHLCAREADPDAGAWIARNWAREALASPRFVDSVAAEGAATRLGAWIGVLRNMVRIDNRERLGKLLVPVLVLWATQDRVFGRTDQADLLAALDAAVRGGHSRYVFKQYGKVPLPTPGVPGSELGHHAHWPAARTFADDIAAWVRTGRPTRDLPCADPVDPHKLVVERDGAALVENSPAGWRPATSS